MERREFLSSGCGGSERAELLQGLIVALERVFFLCVLVMRVRRSEASQVRRAGVACGDSYPIKSIGEDILCHRRVERTTILCLGSCDLPLGPEGVFCG